jgi:hypothetical protein
MGCACFNHFQQYFQGSPHLQNTGRLDFSFREHYGEVKAWQGDFQQLQRHAFAKMCCFLTSFFLNLYLKCAFANILIISFIFNLNSCFVLVLLLLILYLSILDFIRFALKSIRYILHQIVSSLPLFLLKCRHV